MFSGFRRLVQTSHTSDCDQPQQCQQQRETVELHKLCPSCIALSKKVESRVMVNSNKHKGSYRRIRLQKLDPISTSSSSEQGCHLCTMILNSPNQDPSTQLPLKSKLPGAWLFSWLPRPSIEVYYFKNCNTDLHLYFPKSPSCSLRLIDPTYPSTIDKDDPLPSVCPTRIGGLTSSDETFQLASEWLQHCRMNHPACNPQDLSRHILPTRLMKIEHLGSRILPSLIFSRDLNGDVEYTTLTHCWGNLPTLTLTGETFLRMQEGLDMEVVPKTFRDAIVITHRLGYQYIWIDSLCIFQDDPEDWARESITMMNVYRNSACTIAALGAKNSHDGCFSKRNSLHHHPCRLTVNTEKRIYARMDPWRYLDDLFSHDSIYTKASLLSRAWVVQERLLSPRILYYGTTMIFWECSELFASEMRPLGEPSEKALTLPKSSFDMLLHHVGKETKGRLELFLFGWYSIRETYSRCSLTVAEDRLPAIFGVIQAISKATGLHNIAGLWRECLLEELLWHTNGVPNPRPACYIAPSWSWASISGGVAGSNCAKIPKLGLEWMVEIHDVSVVHAHPNGTGPILSGSIVLSGSLYEVDRIQDTESRPCISVYSDDSAKAEWNPDAPIDPSQILWYLEFCVFPVSSFMNYEGLIVVPVDAEPLREENSSVWRRVGYFWNPQKPSPVGKIIEQRRITII